MDDNIVTLHRTHERFAVFDIAGNDAQPGIGDVMCVVPLATGAEIVEQRDQPRRGIGHEMVGEVAPDEACAANDEEPALTGF
jgi:hypothetical protein